MFKHSRSLLNKPSRLSFFPVCLIQNMRCWKNEDQISDLVDIMACLLHHVSFNCVSLYTV